MGALAGSPGYERPRLRPKSQALEPGWLTDLGSKTCCFGASGVPSMKGERRKTEKVPCSPVDRPLIRLQKSSPPYHLPPGGQARNITDSRTRGGKSLPGEHDVWEQSPGWDLPSREGRTTPPPWGGSPGGRGLWGTKMSSPRPPLANEVLFAKTIIIALSME